MATEPRRRAIWQKISAAVIAGVSALMIAGKVQTPHHSDVVFEAVLSLSRRDYVAAGTVLVGLREHLLAAVAAIDAVDAQSR